MFGDGHEELSAFNYNPKVDSGREPKGAEGDIQNDPEFTACEAMRGPLR